MWMYRCTTDLSSTLLKIMSFLCPRQAGMAPADSKPCMCLGHTLPASRVQVGCCTLKVRGIQNPHANPKGTSPVSGINVRKDKLQLVRPCPQVKGKSGPLPGKAKLLSKQYLRYICACCNSVSLWHGAHRAGMRAAIQGAFETFALPL